MSPKLRRVFIAGGFGLGVAILALLAVMAYALLSGGGPDAEVARMRPIGVVKE